MQRIRSSVLCSWLLGHRLGQHCWELQWFWPAGTHLSRVTAGLKPGIDHLTAASTLAAEASQGTVVRLKESAPQKSKVAPVIDTPGTAVLVIATLGPSRLKAPSAAKIVPLPASEHAASGLRSRCLEYLAHTE